MSPSPVIRPEADQLNDIELYIAIDVWWAFQGAVVMGVAMQMFHRAQQIFWTNPANTLAFSALRALEDRCVVHIADAIKDDNNLYPAAKLLARRQDLINHRDAVSHPYLVTWGRPAMRAFAAAHTQWLDNRMLLIWEMRADLYRRLGANARRKPEIPNVGIQMVSLLRAVVVSSFKPEQLAVWTPSDAELQDGLLKFSDAFVEFLEDEVSDATAVEASGRGDSSPP